jgi:dethiobiotin synthetase
VNVFLTGTDTGVGKTFVASLLVRAGRRAGFGTVGFKPICCGDRDDAEALHAAAEGALELNLINPVWLRTPAAPYVASMIENRAIDLTLIRESFRRIRALHGSVIVEGVGGWRVPIERDYFASDLAAEFALPIAVVVPNRLGAINHTLLTVETIRAQGLQCAGLILNESAPPDEAQAIAAATNAGILEELTHLPVLFRVDHEQRGLQLSEAALTRLMGGPTPANNGT